MSEVYPWIGFKRKEDRERFRHRIFSEQKKMHPSVGFGCYPNDSRKMNDKEIWDMIHIHAVQYGNDSTFYILSDVVKFPKNYYWICFRGYWDLLDHLEKILKKEYKNYIYLVAH